VRTGSGRYVGSTRTGGVGTARYGVGTGRYGVGTGRYGGSVRTGRTVSIGSAWTGGTVRNGTG
jgi:hypothetical protein